MDEKELIESRFNFLGYGKLASPIWFIGIEEGFVEESFLMKRFQNSKKGIVIDLVDDMTDVGDHFYWFKKETNEVQKTWNKLIQILLTLEGTEKGNKLEYQKNKLGRKDSNHCLLEFSPLPNKNSRGWSYSSYEKEFWFLKSRKLYENEKFKERRKLLKEKIEIHKPKVVVFYSINKKYLKEWKEIINGDLKTEGRILSHKNENTLYLIIHHPIMSKNEDWKEIIKIIKDNYPTLNF